LLSKSQNIPTFIIAQILPTREVCFVPKQGVIAGEGKYTGFRRESPPTGKRQGKSMNNYQLIFQGTA
jgi:hypothetical protein